MLLVCYLIIIYIYIYIFPQLLQYIFFTPVRITTEVNERRCSWKLLPLFPFIWDWFYSYRLNYYVSLIKNKKLGGEAHRNVLGNTKREDKCNEMWYMRFILSKTIWEHLWTHNYWLKTSRSIFQITYNVSQNI